MADDESYIIDLCDRILGCRALRQHQFDFLRGDPSPRRPLGAKLPVDAYYRDRALVVEYRERQHFEAVAFFDRRQTISGMGRGQQRALYDRRRENVLPAHGITVVVLRVDDFAHDSAKRLRRVPADDEATIRRLLAGVLEGPRRRASGPDPL